MIQVAASNWLEYILIIFKVKINFHEKKMIFYVVKMPKPTNFRSQKRPYRAITAEV